MAMTGPLFSSCVIARIFSPSNIGSETAHPYVRAPSRRVDSKCFRSNLTPSYSISATSLCHRSSRKKRISSSVDCLKIKSLLCDTAFKSLTVPHNRTLARMPTFSAPCMCCFITCHCLLAHLSMLAQHNKRLCSLLLC